MECISQGGLAANVGEEALKVADALLGVKVMQSYPSKMDRREHHRAGHVPTKAHFGQCGIDERFLDLSQV